MLSFPTVNWSLSWQWLWQLGCDNIQSGTNSGCTLGLLNDCHPTKSPSKIWGSHSGVTENSGLQQCDECVTEQVAPAFWTIIAPSTSRVKNTLEDASIKLNIHQQTQHHNPDDQNFNITLLLQTVTDTRTSHHWYSPKHFIAWNSSLLYIYMCVCVCVCVYSSHLTENTICFD